MSEAEWMSGDLNPELSIVIPCFNAGEYLPSTLESLKPLMIAGVEIILVDDGSTDNTREVVEPFLGENVRYYTQRNSGGPASPRNVGIQRARGSFIGLFDSDDISISGHFIHAIKLMKDHPTVGMICGNFDISDETLKIERPRVLDEYSALQNVLVQKVETGAWLLRGDTAFSVLLQKNFVGTSSVIIRKKAFERVGYFDQSLKNLDDRDMWLRVARHYDVIYRDEPTYIYRSVATSISKQGIERQGLERTSVGKKLISEGLSPIHRKLARQWIGRNYLEVGYCRFKLEQKSAARDVFLKSFIYAPSWSAFKGIVKSLLPRSAYLSIKRLKP
ncbi:glycosyltransferase family 2 protein [Marinobacter halotolerans]|uniref:glycosyltransferase family 2 protein n=1 Tax=Marinobacter halotolerans TaxID=1569211 RepID=UPI001248D178|nr:glycosyltransferase [Marinobacter halotolerans]